MLNQELMEVLAAETPWTDFKNVNLLHDFAVFRDQVGMALREGESVPFALQLSQRLGEMDVFKASLLSNFIGFVCEQTGDTSAGPGVLSFFSQTCTTVYQLMQYIDSHDLESILDDPQAMYGVNPQWAAAYFGFETLCISTMAFLARDASLRTALLEMEISDQIQYLVEETPNTPSLKSIYYISETQHACGEQKLLVLHPQRKKGFFATANDLCNCFHLLFLLEEEMSQKLGASYGIPSFSADRSVIQLAHGEYPKDCWGKSYCTAFLACDRSTAFSHPEELAAARPLAPIWGEMPPDYIPTVDGRGVIVLWEHVFPRSFSVEFMAVPHPALNPYVQFERELTDQEYELWMEKLR